MLGTVAAISAGIKGVTGLAQYLKGRKIAKENVRPEYEIPLEMRNKMTSAQLMSFRGLPEEQKQQFLTNMQRSSSNSLSNISSRRGGLAGVGALAQTESDALSGMMSMDAQQRMSNIQNLGNVQSEMAGFQDKAFGLNKLNPYMENAEAAQAMKGAGLQNMMGGLDSAVDIIGQNEYIKSLGAGNKIGAEIPSTPLNDLNTLEQTPQTGSPFYRKKKGFSNYDTATV